MLCVNALAPLLAVDYEPCGRRSVDSSAVALCAGVLDVYYVEVNQHNEGR